MFLIINYIFNEIKVPEMKHVTRLVMSSTVGGRKAHIHVWLSLNFFISVRSQSI